MFKINLPNPTDYSPEDFFQQMKIVIKSAELSYKEMVKGLELNEDNTPYIVYRQTKLKNQLLEDSKEPKKDFDLDDYFEEAQEVELEINLP